MDIHRCRFVQFPPQPINALAFSHTSDSTKKAPTDLRLALGRNNGDIEIWNPANGLWIQETTLRGTKDTTIEQLVWTQDVVLDEDETGSSEGPLRLFSAGGSTTVLEWDPRTGTVKKNAEGNFGDIWCLAAQPQFEASQGTNALPSNTGSQMLAAGCSDGTVVLFSTEDDDLRYIRALAQPPVKKPRVLSITWRDRNTLVAGYEDSMIRIIDVTSRRVIRNMSLGKPTDGNDSIVWTVRCLPDGTIISGDSSGELKIWDSKNFSLVQRLSGHKADILDIATSASGDTIFSIGVDRRTVTYKQVPIHSGTQKTRWAETAHKRYHQHDVKCVASYEAKDLSVLISGGMDTRPVVVPMRRQQTEYHRALSHLPQTTHISASRASRLFISWWDREIFVYHVRKYQDQQLITDSSETENTHYETLARIVMQDEANIEDAKISEGGQFIVVTTINSVKLFQLRHSQVEGKPSLRTRQIELPRSMSHFGARKVGFSPDGKWLYCARKDNAIALTKIISTDNPKEQPAIHEKTVKVYRQSRTRQDSVLGTYTETISQVAFSDDSRALAVGDISGAIDAWILEGHEDLNFIDTPAPQDDSSDSSDSSDDDDDDDAPIIHGQKWIRNLSGSALPKLDSAILALTFRPSSHHDTTHSPVHDNLGVHPTRHNPHPVAQEHPSPSSTKLLAVTATHQLVEFDILHARLSDWSRRNPSTYLPRSLKRIKDRVVGCFWDRARDGPRLWLYGSSWLAMLDVSKDLPREQQYHGSYKNGIQKDLDDAEKKGRLGDYDVLEPVLNGSTVNPTKNQPQEKSAALTKTTINPLVRPTQQTPTSKKRKRNTGAGDHIRIQQRESGVGNSIRRFKDPAGEDIQIIDVNTEDTVDAGDDEMDIEDIAQNGGSDTLALMRRGEEPPQTTIPPTPGGDNDENEADARKDPPAAKMTRKWSHWHTFEYQAILGIAVIGPPPPSSSPVNQEVTTNGNEIASSHGGTVQHEHEHGENIEVVIVERPLHEIAQAPRFDGGQEWDA